MNLTVAATPEIAPAIKQVAEQWRQGGAEVGGTCVTVTVDAQNASTVAGAVSRDHSVSLVGLDPAPDAVQAPDVWVPDSTTWLQRLQTEAAGFLPSEVTSVAQSPLVLAAPEPVAQQLGWPSKKIGWTDLMGNFTSDEPLAVGIMNPTVDASGLTSLLAISQAVGANTPEGAEAKTRAMTALSTNKFQLREELMAKFPKSQADLANSDSVLLAPVSEEDVVAYNAQRPAIQLSAMYLEPSPAPLDYPYTIMPQLVDQQKSAAAKGLLEQLTAAAAKDTLAAAGLRAPDGTYGASFAAPMGAPQASPAVAATASKSASGGTAAAAGSGAALSAVVGSWIAITTPGRALTVFDTSGSMAIKVPTANGASRAQVTQAAARTGLGLFSDKWSVGVWKFSTNEDGEKPYKQLVPISALSTGRPALQSSIDKLNPTETGGTGLYDTLLAAYSHVKKDWTKGKINSVILFTDGKNDYAAGLKQDVFLSELKKQLDPTKPIRVILIGIGNEVSEQELKTIQSVDEKNFGVFIADDPTKITTIFAQAIGSRTGVK
ncbi:substrate-binding domain-containing protein [Actinoplanes sp. NEAU-A12]|uniref:Substrate-binding domain-containing protein n=1 Tax=Actinoplanes sandaracinus TaxID=3045177 RepID=A0ABT6WQF2_9ACTN|nr:substrate-binding domain-containing protein [Actinoplanes sandaracinus]MDI6101966.1 substrate-binding domain-containing protein [Actinoplanes sandaracinus]